MLNADDVEVIEFLQLWPAPFGRKVRAVPRRKFIALDYANGPDSWCGMFLVDRLTHQVYRIKGYGRPGTHCGTIESLISAYRQQRAIHGKTF
jgi:hypothetical protein